MKKFVRTPWVQSALAWLVSVYLGLTLATMRWRYENRGAADQAVASPDGLVALFWHGRIALAVNCRRVLKLKPRRVLISNSPDGELIAKIVARLSFPAIRGSTTMDNRANRRSIGAFRDAIKFIDDGGVVAITPDGPRGPAEKMPEGPVMLARARGTPVYLFGLAARPTLTLKSWDKTQIPIPFGQGCVVFEGPLSISRGADAETIERTRSDWETRLSAVQARAEALLAS
ncbi:MAG TPA: lysophospholipid acyltransferase family protein [Caulobacteraceae bacterium]|nr:lysophospholipid acyltransferase family protein [Caulobacteraceae bacterium]